MENHPEEQPVQQENAASYELCEDHLAQVEKDALPEQPQEFHPREPPLNGKFRGDLGSLENEDSAHDEKAHNRVFCFGNAECDQFYIDGENFESKRPVEVPFFGKAKVKVMKIACGTQHSMVLSENGKVFTWGNADDGCLGREIIQRSTIPGEVVLPIAVDLISTGESHSICANSLTGAIFIWGTIKSSLKGKLFNHSSPKEMNFYTFNRKGIQDLKSGANHIVVLSGKKAFTWGDNDTGALGTHFREHMEEKKIFEPNGLKVTNVVRIFVGANNTFLQNAKGHIYGCGLNNYGQVGIDQNGSDDYVVRIPEPVPALDGLEVAEIVGGEHHTIVLMKNGAVYGAGRNDDGQLGELNESDSIGGFKRLDHIDNIEHVISANHYNYAKQKKEDSYYAWGFGMSFVLANGREDSLTEARKINNEKFFTEGFPSYVSLGHSFVSFSINPLGNSDLLKKVIAESKPKKRLPASKLAREDAKKVHAFNN